MSAVEILPILIPNRPPFSEGHDPQPRDDGQYNPYAEHRQQPTVYAHRLWLPEIAPDGEELSPGCLVATMYPPSNGRIQEGGMNYYHYAIARSIHNLAAFGFLQEQGFYTAYRRRQNVSGGAHTISVAFPSARRFVSTANNASLPGSERPLQFVLMPPGEYSTEGFVSMLAERQYPISQEVSPDTAQPGNLDHGSHDVLAHGAAMLALPDIVIDCLQARAQKMLGHSALDPIFGDAGYRHRNRISLFMDYAEEYLNVRKVEELIEYPNRETSTVFRWLLGLQNIGKSESLKPYIGAIRARIGAPHAAGALAVTQEV